MIPDILSVSLQPKPMKTKMIVGKRGGEGVPLNRTVNSSLAGASFWGEEAPLQVLNRCGFELSSGCASSHIPTGSGDSDKEAATISMNATQQRKEAPGPAPKPR